MNETINKEVSDALHMLLHCALKDKEFETQKEQFHIVYDYIEKLEAELNNTVTRKKYRQTKKTLKGQIRESNAVIDEMAKCIYEIAKIKPMTVDKLLGDKICLWEDCDNINREVDCDYCIKEYFYKKARDNK